MKKLFLLLLALPLSLPAAQPDFQAACAELGSVKRAHPYLLFTAEEKPALLQRIRADRQSAEVFEKFLLEGRRLVHAPVERDAPPARELHVRYVGAGDESTRFVNQHLNAAFTLAFLYQMTGDEQYVPKAFYHANIVCAQENWMQTPHQFDVIYPRVWPYGARDDQVAFTYDITASSVTQHLAFIYDWLYPALPKAQRDRIRGALLEKAIMRVRGNYEYLWWATAYKCNWSGICHTGLGLAALALLDEDPQLVDVAVRSSEGVWNMLEHIGADGGWQEGRGYWAFGLGESLRFIDVIRRVTGGKIDLFKHRSLSPHPVDFALYGLTGGFGDGNGNPVGHSAVINKLAQESGDPTAAWYAVNYVHSQEAIFDLLWPATTVKPVKPAETSKFFPSIDWAVMRKDFGPDYLTVATKAGMNDDPHHGHLDIGTFNLTWQNLTFVGEGTRPYYDEQYFGAMRWDYLGARTSGHNCVMVNGEEQAEAKLKDQPWRNGIGGHITFYTSEPAWAGVAMDPTHAYPGKELKAWNRWIALDKETNVVVVLDRVACAVGAEIEVRFHPGVEANVGKDHVVLHAAATDSTARGGRNANATRREGENPAPRARRAELEMLPLVNGDFSLVHGRQPDMPVTQEQQLTWSPYFSTIVKAPATDNVIASVFCPGDLRSGDGALVCKLDASGATPAITYTVRGKTTRLVFALDRITRTVN